MGVRQAPGCMNWAWMSTWTFILRVEGGFKEEYDDMWFTL